MDYSKHHTLLQTLRMGYVHDYDRPQPGLGIASQTCIKNWMYTLLSLEPEPLKCIVTKCTFSDCSTRQLEVRFIYMYMYMYLGWTTAFYSDGIFTVRHIEQPHAVWCYSTKVLILKYCQFCVTSIIIIIIVVQVLGQSMFVESFLF